MKKKIFPFLFFIGTATLFNAQVTYTFTNAGATGRTGPNQSLINSAYASTNLTGLVTCPSGIQSFTVPSTGVYNFTIAGAKSGDYLNTIAPGYGRKISGSYALTGGTVLQIVVGQMGMAMNNNSSSYISNYASYKTTNAGGGGGSFVYLGNTLLYAAGGGGAPNGYRNAPGQNANFSTSGSAGGGGGAGGINGAGGAGGGSGATAGINGVGGLGPNGTDGPGGGGGGMGVLPSTFLGGLTSSPYGSDGGFGGGGSCAGGNNISAGGGGGGGYSGGGGGGGGGAFDGLGYGGGGGSYGINTITDLGLNNAHGVVIIKKVTGIAIFQTASITCNGAANAALSTTITGAIAPYTYTWFPSGGNGSGVSSVAAGSYTCIATDAASVTYSDSFIITQPPVLSSSVNSQTNVTCNGGSNGAISVSGSGGVNPYSYSWSPSGGNASSATGLTPGTYTCVIADANNCVSSVIASVTQPTPVNVVAFASSTAVCLGDAVTFIGGGANNYTWTGGVTNGVPYTPTVSSNYIVTGFNSIGCPGYAQTSVVVNPVPVVSVAVSTILACPGVSSTLSASGASTYSWSNNGTGSITTVSPSIATLYTVTGTSTLGCKNTATVSVSTYTLPTISVAQTGTAVCAGSSITVFGQGALTFTWTGGITNGVAFSPASTTIYTVSGTNGSGCVNSATTSVVVNPLPILSINGSTSICQGNVALLTAGGAATYLWNTNANTASISVSPQISTNYTVTGTSTQGCVNSATVGLLVNTSPTVSAGVSNTLLCKGASLTLTANGAASYTWEPSLSNNPSISITPSVTTSYSLTGNSNGCSNSAVITISVIPSPTLTLTGSGTVCALSTVTLTASGASSYTWGTGVNTPTAILNPSVTAWISVIGSGTNGCTKTDSIYQVVKPLPNLIITSSNSIVCEGETTSTLNIGGAGSYTWSTLETDSSIVVSPTVTTSYSVTGLGSNGCSNAAYFLLSVTNCDGVTALIEGSSSISIYPNPSSGSFNITGVGDIQLNLVDALGQLVKVLTLNESNAHSVYVNRLSNGVYFITGKHKQQIISQKIIITN